MENNSANNSFEKEAVSFQVTAVPETGDAGTAADVQPAAEARAEAPVVEAYAKPASRPRVKEVILPCGGDSLLPFVLVYMCYIILHGHLSPGGGFQGGVLMVAAVMLLYFGHGYKTTTQAVSFNLMHEGEGVASVFYVALALMGVFAGAQFCQNILYRHGAIGDLYSAGTIFWMNVTVGVKVLTGIGSITLLMLGLVANREGGEEE